MDFQKFFAEESKTYGVDFNMELLQELLMKNEYDRVERGMAFPNAHCNRVLKEAIKKMQIPEYLSAQLLDHVYTFFIDYAAYYRNADCVINCYYNPSQKKAAYKAITTGFHKIFGEAEEMAEEEIAVYRQGLYNPEHTFAIFVPGSVLHAYTELLKTKIIQIVYINLPQDEQDKLTEAGLADMWMELSNYFQMR